MVKKLCLLLWMVPAFTCAQNRYDTPASYSYVSTYIPMSHEELMLRAAAKVLREKQAKEDFEHYSQTAYDYLKKNQVSYFINYAHAALGAGYYNSQLYYNLGISYFLLGQKGKGKKFLKKASKSGFYPANQALLAVKKKYVFSNSQFIY